MCPDGQIVSLYIDRELPSPWKEKMEAHLESCGACRLRLEQYRRLRSALTEVPGEDLESAKSRVWSALAAGKGGTKPAGITVSPVTKKNLKSIWTRTVSLPLPAAAAAAAVFVIIAFFAVLGVRPSVPARIQDAAVAGIGTDLQGIAPVSDITGVLQYLSSQDSADYVIIKLPESRNFSSSGEPALLKAADYTRRQSSQ
ncbi:MAG: zf-HC2 domain-containing protein [Treponema sp.]|jgi:anti-sigma factor RsiW|nr:zf-HC2 domain-containing protein [Treponema sp.]